MDRLAVDGLPVVGTFVVGEGVEERFAEGCVGGDAAALVSGVGVFLFVPVSMAFGEAAVVVVVSVMVVTVMFAGVTVAVIVVVVMVPGSISGFG